MKMNKFVLSVSFLAMTAFFAACGDDSGSNAKDDEKEKISLQVNEFDDLPDCDKKHEGDVARVKSEANLYVCDDGEWVEQDSADKSEATKEKSSSSVKKSGKSSESKNSDDDQESSESKGKSKSSDSKDGLESSDSKGSSASDENLNSSSSKGPSSSSSKKTELSNSGTITDPRDGQRYKYVRIGSQVWFAQNLNYDDGRGVCPMNESPNCDKYGRLYTFINTLDRTNSTKLICPSGWHLPDSSEWKNLISYVSKNNGEEPVGVSLKSVDGWISEGTSVTVEEGEDERVGATKGTDKFGFAALPAGSCWDRGRECYVGDDTRFAISDVEGGFKLAFDKDEFSYDIDAYTGFISVRCLKNDLEIDSMPSISVVDDVVWMAEDLSHGGSKIFTASEASQACPDGWRLPVEEDFRAMVESGFAPALSMKGSYYSGESFAEENVYGSRVECSGPNNVSCFFVNHEMHPEHVRCVMNEKIKKSSGECACETSGYDSKTKTASWTASCSKGSFEYLWDFGEYSKGVDVSGKTASRVFNELIKISPQVTVREKVEVLGETYNLDHLLECPAVVAGDAVIEFENGSLERVDILSGTTYTAVISGESCTSGIFSCQFSYDDLHQDDATIVINGTSFSSVGVFWSSSDIDFACGGKPFTIEVSADAQCAMSWW